MFKPLWTLSCGALLGLAAVALSLHAQTAEEHWQSIVANAHIGPAPMDVSAIPACADPKARERLHANVADVAGSPASKSVEWLDARTPEGVALVASHMPSQTELAMYAKKRGPIAVIVLLIEEPTMRPTAGRLAASGVPLVYAKKTRNTRSTLFSRPAIQLQEWSAPIGGGDLHMLATIDGLIALSIYTGPATVVSLRQPAIGNGGISDDPEIELSSYEYLYATLLHQDIDRRYSLEWTGIASVRKRMNGSATGGKSSQWDVLRMVALARSCAALRFTRATGIRLPIWRMTWLTRTRPQHPMSNSDAEVVGVVAKAAGSRLMEKSINVFRPPHKECVATTGPGGLASCRLIDLHRHPEGNHADESANPQPLIASFGGSVESREVFLPSTVLFANR